MEAETCGSEEILTFSYTFSIMVTTEENKTYAPSLSLKENADSSNKKSWADCVQEFSSNLETNNTFYDDDGTLFFVVKNVEDFSKTSPFLIRKAIEPIVRTTKTIKILHSGALII